MTLVDTNILLDIVSGDPVWFNWSTYQLDAARLRGGLAINDIIYTECSIRFAAAQALDSFLDDADIAVRPMPRAALFAAGKAFARYRANGGKRPAVLPDFFIGAQASAENLPLLTRDRGRYQTYFPAIALISPPQ